MAVESYYSKWPPRWRDGQKFGIKRLVTAIGPFAVANKNTNRAWRNQKGVPNFYVADLSFPNQYANGPDGC
jgi:hypothetical protein